jgi:uncharacterized protein YjbJ (UPF0337 family)
MKSSKRDKAEGAIDRIAGKILDFFGRLTGNTSHRAKGNAAKGRGAFRTGKGRAKSAGGR